MSTDVTDGTPPAESTDAGPGRGQYGVTFWIGLVIGGAILTYGLRGVFDELGPDNPTKLAIWVVGLDVAHDLVLAPVLVLAGLAVGALVGPRHRGPVRVAGALTGLVVLFSIPLLTAWGRRPGNSSTLPLNYAHSVVVVVGAIWLTAGVVMAGRAVHDRRAHVSDPASTDARPDP